MCSKTHNRYIQLEDGTDGSPLQWHCMKDASKLTALFTWNKYDYTSFHSVLTVTKYVSWFCFGSVSFTELLKRRLSLYQALEVPFGKGVMCGQWQLV